MTSVTPAGVLTLTRRRVATLLSLGLSVLLLYILYRSIDLRTVGRVLGGASPMWVVISMSVLLPITFARALRFLWLLPVKAREGIVDAIALTVVSSAVNTLLPAKAGDFTKSLVVARRGNTTVANAIAVVAYERVLDLAGLLAWCTVSFIAYRPDTQLPLPVWCGLIAAGIVFAILALSESAARVIPTLVRQLVRGRSDRIIGLANAWPDLVTSLRGNRVAISVLSIAIWLLQLWQLWLFTVVVGADIPLGTSLSLSAIALLVALLPITLGGIGARDAALVVLLAGYMSPEQAAAVGVLATLRGFLVPAMALPWIRSYVGQALNPRSST